MDEFEGILNEMVVQNGRKMVLFSEWTTMTYLIARRLSDAGISFVELSGKVPVKKRQALIDEFTHNPDCKVFLSTDAGGTGLNLQAADCVVNFELPWNPARMRQRIGRVNRIGQESGCVNVVNLISKDSIEMKILAGLQLKTDLFQGVFDGGVTEVDFSREKRTQLVNQLREMLAEEPLPVAGESNASEEIPEDTPHDLNPEVLRQREESEEGEESREGEVDYTGEEIGGIPSEAESEAESEANLGSELASDSGAARGSSGGRSPAESPEKLEQVLNQGMQFIGGLMEMATGKPLQGTGDDGRMLNINKETGEVTLKFKLPGF
jgi:superfamily II DNA/RNA helicase